MKKSNFQNDYRFLHSLLTHSLTWGTMTASTALTVTILSEKTYPPTKMAKQENFDINN